MACITGCKLKCNPFTLIENLRRIATAKSALVMRCGFSMNLKGMQSVMHAMTIDSRKFSHLLGIGHAISSAPVSGLRLLERVELVPATQPSGSSNQNAAFGTSQTAEVSTCNHEEIVNHAPEHACHPGVRGALIRPFIPLLGTLLVTSPSNSLIVPR